MSDGMLAIWVVEPDSDLDKAVEKYRHIPQGSGIAPNTPKTGNSGPRFSWF